MTLEFWLAFIGLLAFSTVAGAVVVKKARPLGWGVLTAILAVYLTGANILVGRLVEIELGWTFVLVTGSIIWPFTSQITDMLNEIYGRRKTYISAAVAYGANLLFVGMVLMAMQIQSTLWPAEAEVWWRQYFGITGRVLAASAVAYALSQWANIYLFAWVKRRLIRQEQTLWNAAKGGFIRSWTSDVATTVIENPVFYTLAFFGALPNETLVSLIGSAMAAKLIIGHFNQPFFLGFRALVMGVEREV